jgi:hypothetical protein
MKETQDRFSEPPADRETELSASARLAGAGVRRILALSHAPVLHRLAAGTKSGTAWTRQARVTEPKFIDAILEFDWPWPRWSTVRGGTSIP